MKRQYSLEGKIYVVGDNVDTDVIIPARYLTSMDPATLKPHLFEDLPDRKPYEEGMNILIAGRNFGCGSSREHAPIAIGAAGFKAVIAESFARIFWRNSINGATLLPLKLADRPEREDYGSVLRDTSNERLCDVLKNGDKVWIDYDSGEIQTMHGLCYFKPHTPLQREIIEAGGLTAYNKRRLNLK